MIRRFSIFLVAAFWLTMNGLLWQMEYGSQGGDMPVPLQLVWRKILTAPDSSSLSVYQNSDRTGYCELSTSVGQQMATMDDNKPPPEGFVLGTGYQLHFAGNIALGDFTNRLKFDGHVIFNLQRKWQEINLKISARQTTVEIHSRSTNQVVHVRVNGPGGDLDREIPFQTLENPAALVRVFDADVADFLLDGLDLTGMPGFSTDQKLECTARRTRLKIGNEYVPVYRLETTVLGHEISVDVSTLGEILRIRLPDNITAIIDELNRP